MTKAMLSRDGRSPLRGDARSDGSPRLSELGSKKGIVVLNDEAHHCYRHRVGSDGAEEKLTGDERREAAAP